MDDTYRCVLININYTYRIRRFTRIKSKNYKLYSWADKKNINLLFKTRMSHTNRTCTLGKYNKGTDGITNTSNQTFIFNFI